MIRIVHRSQELDDTEDGIFAWASVFCDALHVQPLLIDTTVVFLYLLWRSFHSFHSYHSFHLPFANNNNNNNSNSTAKAPAATAAIPPTTYTNTLMYARLQTVFFPLTSRGRSRWCLVGLPLCCMEIMGVQPTSSRVTFGRASPLGKPLEACARTTKKKPSKKHEGGKSTIINLLLYYALFLCIYINIDICGTHIYLSIYLSIYLRIWIYLFICLSIFFYPVLSYLILSIYMSQPLIRLSRYRWSRSAVLRRRWSMSLVLAEIPFGSWWRPSGRKWISETGQKRDGDIADSVATKHMW